MENTIQRVRIMLQYLSPREVMFKLVGEGISRENAYLATIAANICNSHSREYISHD